MFNLHNSVFVITGAAGSIVSAITQDLAAASGGKFYLLDRTPMPDPSNPDLERFVTDPDGLKRDLYERIKQRGQRATPVLVQKELAALERARAARAAIRAVQDAGGTVHYYCVDLTDGAAVARVVDDIRERDGRIDVLIHAAGLEISHPLPDKSREEYDLVFDVKCDGWFNLMKAIGDLPLRTAIVFSSIAARFGNFGQTDYSAANDLLCKCVSSLRSVRPDTRGLSIDWTAWAEIGMASRGSIPAVMREVGVDMLPPQLGVTIPRRGLCASGFGGELVVSHDQGIRYGHQLAVHLVGVFIDPDIVAKRLRHTLVTRYAF